MNRLTASAKMGAVLRSLVARTYAVRRPLFAVVVALYLGALGAMLLGASTVAIVLIAVAGLALIPLRALAESRPRAGLLWYGSFAEPWRVERSPGQPVLPDDRPPPR